MEAQHGYQEIGKIRREKEQAAERQQEDVAGSQPP